MCYRLIEQQEYQEALKAAGSLRQSLSGVGELLAITQR